MKHSKVLFVCMANVCRSPMAEWIMQERIRQGNGQFENHRIDVRSAGIASHNGSDASDQALMVMRERKVDGSRHRARLINQEIVDWSDLILCMTEDQLASLKKSFPDVQDKFYLLTEYCGGSGDIDDPSGKPTRAFEDCALQLDGLIGSVLERIK